MRNQEEISQSEYARRHGWVHSYVSKLVSQGKISTLPNGKIDPVAADKELELSRGYTAHGPRGRSLCDDEGDHALDLSTLSEEQGKQLLIQAWDQFFRISELLWQLSRPKRLTKQIMLGIVQGLR